MTKMNKTELIEALAARTETTKVAAARTVDAIMGIITAQVANGQEVTLTGFGTFKAAKRDARTGKNPKTGESIQIAATRVPTFKAGAAFKAAVAPDQKPRR